MAPYKILKQGYMEKEPPLSKRGLRKVCVCVCVCVCVSCLEDLLYL